MAGAGSVRAIKLVAPPSHFANSTGNAGIANVIAKARRVAWLPVLL